MVQYVTNSHECNLGVSINITFSCPIDRSPRWTYSFWAIISFYIWLWIIIIGMIFCYVRVYLKARAATTVLRLLIESALSKLWAYPVIISLLWLIPVIVDTNRAIWLSEATEPPQWVNDTAFGLPFLSGIFTAAFFFHANPSVRGTLIAFITCSGKNEDISQSVDASKILRPKIICNTPPIAVVNPLRCVEQNNVVKGGGDNQNTDRPSEVEFGKLNEI